MIDIYKVKNSEALGNKKSYYNVEKLYEYVNEYYEYNVKVATKYYEKASELGHEKA